MIVFKKNQVVTIVMAGLIIVAGYLNFTYTNKNMENDPEILSASNDIKEEIENYGEAHFVNAPTDAKSDYFNETIKKKEIARSEALSIIREVVASDSSDSEVRKNAQNTMMVIARNIEKEANIENILMGKGFSKVSAYLNEGGITVAVMTDGLKPEDIAKIRDVVISETGLTADKIKIMEIN